MGQRLREDSGLRMTLFYGKPLLCWLLLSLPLSLPALPSCDLQRPSRLCQLVMEHIEQSENGSLHSAPRSKEVNLVSGGDQDEHLLQSLSALLKESRREDEEVVEKKRRNHNDNDPGHVFLRFGRQTG